MNLAEKASQGIYDLVEPLDYLILELLPEEGELVMGYYPLTKTTRQLQKEKFADFSPGEMAGCMKRLSLQSLVVRVRTRGRKQSSYGYQRTAKGKELYEEWKKKQPKEQPPKSTPDKSGGE